MKQDSWDVIVVGGGYCGVTAAVELGRRVPGIRLLLLEADSRLGGRTRSIALQSNAEGQTQWFDFGGHYFGVHQRRIASLARGLLRPEQIFSRVKMYGEDPAFRNFLEGNWKTTTKKGSILEIQGLDKKSSWYERLSVFKTLAWYFVAENLVHVREPWRTPFARALDRITVADWIEKQRIPQWLKEMWGLACTDIMSIYPRQISLLYWLWYNASNLGFLEVANDMTDGPQEFAVEIGLGGLLQRYAEEIPGTTRLDSPVVRIDHRQADRVEVTTAAGKVETASRVIVAATPAAVGRHMRFDPPLHPARTLLNSQPAGHAAKAIFVYREPWWWDSHGLHYFGMTTGPFAEGIEWMLDSSHPGGKQYSLMSWVNEKFFERFQDSADEEAMKRALAEEMARCMDDTRALDYLSIGVFQWRRAAYVGGGPNTCFGPEVLSRLAPVFNRPEGPSQRLYFASAEYSTASTGYVEGAIASGEFVASQVAYDAAKAGEASPPIRPSSPELPGRGRRLLLVPAYLIAWLALVAAAACAYPFSRR